MNNHFLNILIRLDTDYTDYGGKVVRYSDVESNFPDCASGCRWFNRIDDDYGICTKPNAPRAGMLTYQHQAGYGCYE